jgi:hypothetical protein
MDPNIPPTGSTLILIRIVRVICRSGECLLTAHISNNCRLMKTLTDLRIPHPTINGSCRSHALRMKNKVICLERMSSCALWMFKPKRSKILRMYFMEARVPSMCLHGVSTEKKLHLLVTWLNKTCQCFRNRITNEPHISTFLFVCGVSPSPVLYHFSYNGL